MPLSNLTKMNSKVSDSWDQILYLGSIFRKNVSINIRLSDQSIVQSMQLQLKMRFGSKYERGILASDIFILILNFVNFYLFKLCYMYLIFRFG